MNSHVKTNGTRRAARKYVYGFTEDSPWSKTPHLLNPFEPRQRTWQEHVHYVTIVNEICEIGLTDPGLHQFISSQKYDIGVATEYEYCGFALMKHYNIASIVSASSLPLLDQQSISAGIPNSAAVTQAIFETEDLTTLWGRLKNLVNWAHINFVIYPYCQKLQGDLIRKHLGDHLEPAELAHSLDLAFVNSNELIDIPRAVSHKIKYIGGINLRKSSRKLDAETERAVSATPSSGIVVFCFGTQVPSSVFPIEVRRAFASAFRHFPQYTFVWKYEPQEGDRQIFANTTNVHFLKWLPQTDLLNDPRTRAFISHVGLNSYVEASYAGVPILAVPLFADQPQNALAGHSLGTTFVLDKTKITTQTVVRGLEAVLHDSSYNLNAKRISKMLQERPNSPKKLFVEWLEFAARNPLLHRNLNLAGQKLDVFRYYCIDVIAICLFSILLSLFALFRGVVLISRRVSTRKVELKMKIQ
ncbi:unnamed protein product [Caenorhabditis sp. 36 PRJEB53466]|nr:unnamed protein product [Caenorhabditis sp. 36 PRJEB53466]